MLKGKRFMNYLTTKLNVSKLSKENIAKKIIALYEKY